MNHTTFGPEGRRLRIALVEPFFGGSHRAVAEGWARHSRHEIELVTLPARFWKWRMRGAAVHLARALAGRIGRFDLLWATSLLDLAHLRALLPRRVPAALYFHENQVAYPTRPGEAPAERDLQYAFTNLASALAADRVVFNSAFQREAFLEGLDRLLGRMPDARPRWAVAEIAARSGVLWPGVEVADIPQPGPREGLPVILWNHRWEHDKDPELFFGVLLRLADEGVPFRVAVAGERFGRAPPVFEEARARLGPRVVHWGYVPDRKAYGRLLARCHVVVSTARQENFGLSVVEAAYAGAHPLVPARLAYPEVVPTEFHAACLYGDPEDLAARIRSLCTGREKLLDPGRLRAAFGRYAWEKRGTAFDEAAERLSGSAADVV
ncbi:tRNA-queuosine alpha-mannosyltransferase domain-containing protein [Deferrisoma palaeochoriense]